MGLFVDGTVSHLPLFEEQVTWYQQIDQHKHFTYFRILSKENGEIDTQKNFPLWRTSSISSTDFRANLEIHWELYP